ncbi:MAG: hypothetical protein ACE5MI_00075 [Acidimicrobiia bacterium]
MFEAVEFIEDRERTREQLLGKFSVELDAVARGRVAREAYLAGGSEDYAWWVVREEGATLARWIADSKSDREFVLDLTTGELTEIV